MINTSRIAYINYLHKHDTMSEDHKTVVGKLLHKLFENFKSNWKKWIVKIANNVPKELGDKLAIVVTIVENFKNFVDSPVADLITTIIPGDLDDNLKLLFRKVLNDYKVEDYLNDNAGHLHLLATHLTKDFTGLSFGQSAVTIEAKYQLMKANKEL